MDVGINMPWMTGATECSGKPRMLNGIVDMGAYEFAFQADLRVLLEGPYQTNVHAMATALGDNIPFSAPYAADRSGTLAIPSNATDWVLLELCEPDGRVAYSRNAVVSCDGLLLSPNGSTGLTVEVPTANYNVMIKYRNHLAVMSAQPVAFTNSVVSYDFTTGPDKYLGGTNACIQLEPGVWGMIAGDVDGDGKITAVDRQIVTQQMGKTGYLPGDINLDGIVTEGDIP